MSSLHALHAPSAASRWIPCPGSIAASRDAPPERPSIFADEGTRAHAVFAQCFLTGAEVGDLLEDASMQLPLQRAVDWARTIIGRRPVLIEQLLLPLRDVPSLWGTGDVCIFDADQLAEGIIDLKYGAGLPVEVWIEGKKGYTRGDPALVAKAKALRNQGQTLLSIAAALAVQGHVTRSGLPFSAGQVKRLVEAR